MGWTLPAGVGKPSGNNREHGINVALFRTVDFNNIVNERNRARPWAKARLDIKVTVT
jgi:hypothetical protein